MLDDSDGLVLCSGFNGFGQLGDDTLSQRTVPTRVLQPER